MLQEEQENNFYTDTGNRYSTDEVDILEKRK